MIARLILILALACAASSAYADPGSAPHEVDFAHYGTTPLPFRWLLCDGLVNAGATECKPTTGLQPKWGKADSVVFNISKAQSNCEPGTIQIQESDTFSSSLPSVWHTVCSLTGVASPLVSGCTLTRRPKQFVRAFLAAAIADADCTDVDVIMEGQDLQLP